VSLDDPSWPQMILRVDSLLNRRFVMRNTFHVEGWNKGLLPFV